MKIYHIRVSILKSSERDNEIEITEYKVIAENKDYLVIDNPTFSTIQKKGEDFLYSSLNKHKVWEWNDGFVTLDGIHYEDYTTRKTSPHVIKNRIEAFLNKRYGYISRIDLSFLTEREQ